MTDDRIFKSKVREVAELNGISYNEAKKAVIQLNNRIDEYKAYLLETENSIMMKDVYENYEEQVFSLSLPLFEEDIDGKCFGRKEEYLPGKYFQLKLTSEQKVNYIDFLPLKNGFRKIKLSNITDMQSLNVDSDTVSTLYFHLAEQFGKNKSYFVNEENLITRLPRIIKIVQEYDGAEDLLIGIQFYSNMEYEKMATNGQYSQLVIIRELFNRLKNSAKNKNVCLIYTDYEANQRTCVNVDDFEIKYYPFDKKHGGSHHRSTQDIVLGHSKGTPHFAKERLVFIENEENETCLKKIFETNNDKKNINWLSFNNDEELVKALSEYDSQRGYVFNEKPLDDLSTPISDDLSMPITDGKLMTSNEALFLKLGFNMNDDSLEKFFKFLGKFMYDLKKNSQIYDDYTQRPSSNSIIIESPDAEILSNWAQDNALNRRDSIISSKYVLVGNALYNNDAGELNLYKA